MVQSSFVALTWRMRRSIVRWSVKSLRSPSPPRKNFARVTPLPLWKLCRKPNRRRLPNRKRHRRRAASHRWLEMQSASSSSRRRKIKALWLRTNELLSYPNFQRRRERLPWRPQSQVRRPLRRVQLVPLSRSHLHSQRKLRTNLCPKLCLSRHHHRRWQLPHQERLRRSPLHQLHSLRWSQLQRLPRRSRLWQVLLPRERVDLSLRLNRLCDHRDTPNGTFSHRERASAGSSPSGAQNCLAFEILDIWTTTTSSSPSGSLGCCAATTTSFWNPTIVTFLRNSMTSSTSTSRACTATWGRDTGPSSQSRISTWSSGRRTGSCVALKLELSGNWQLWTCRIASRMWRPAKVMTNPSSTRWGLLRWSSRSSRLTTSSRWRIWRGDSTQGFPFIPTWRKPRSQKSSV